MGWSFEVHNRQKAQRVVTRPIQPADKSGRYRHGLGERAAGAKAFLSALAVLTVAWISKDLRKPKHQGRINSSKRKLLMNLRNRANSQLAALGSFKSTIAQNCRRGLESAGRLRHKNSHDCVSLETSTSIDNAALSENNVLSDQEAATVVPTASNTESISSTILCDAQNQAGQIPSGGLGTQLSQSATSESRTPSSPGAPLAVQSFTNQAKYLDVAAEESSLDPPTVSRPSKSSTKRNKRKGKKGKH